MKPTKEDRDNLRLWIGHWCIRPPHRFKVKIVADRLQVRTNIAARDLDDSTPRWNGFAVEWLFSQRINT